MKPLKIFFIAITACMFAFLSYPQAAFQNLGFESANIQPAQAPGIVNVADALPGWDVHLGAGTPSQMGYNAVDSGTTWVTLLGKTGSGTFYNSIQGNFGVLLQGGLSQSGASISQTGLVPASAKSILFEAQPGFGLLEVSLDGENIPLFHLVTSKNFNLYGGDVSAFAGQNQDLEFTALNAQSAGRNDWNIDAIVFSSESTPEPSIWTLMLCGAGAFAWRRWAKRR